MPEVKVESVDRTLKEVTMRVLNVYIVFTKKNGKIKCISKYTYDGSSVVVPKNLYLKAVKTSAAIIRDMER